MAEEPIPEEIRKLSFEQALEALQKIVNKMEQGESALDQAEPPPVKVIIHERLARLYLDQGDGEAALRTIDPELRSVLIATPAAAHPELSEPRLTGVTPSYITNASK